MKTKTPRKSKLRKLRLPQVTSIKEPSANKLFQGFPLEHYSYSSFTKFSTNPYMFKVNNINGDQIETTTSPGNVIGRAVHQALQTYFGGGNEPAPMDDGEAIKLGHSVGVDFLKGFSDGLIEYNTRIENRSKIDEKFAFSFFGYLKEVDFRKEIKQILMVEKKLTHRVAIDGRELPVPITGAADLVYRNHKDQIIIRDHKFTAKYSDAEAIDGAKLIQAAFYYFLVYAELGEAPHSIIFEEFKITENQDKSRQTREFEIVYGKHPLIFDFFHRFYEDVTNALLGHQVYVPNLYAIFDREVSILAYIHRLDVDDEREKAFKKMGVDNITDFLKRKIQSDGAMKKYLETVSEKFISAKSLNYASMTTEERIKMKLAEHGLGVEFDSKIVGGSVTLYRYEPSVGLKMSKIEAYAKDIEQVVKTSGIRVLAPIPNSGLVGFEVPNTERTFPSKAPAQEGFTIPIGVDIMGKPVCIELRDAPHVLIAGSTGSGKSVCMSQIIESTLAIKNSDVHLIDPKMVELAPFAKRAASYSEDLINIKNRLSGFVADMEQCYKILQKEGVRNIRELPSSHPMRYRFIFIDEFADLILQDKHARQGKRKKIEEGEPTIEELIVRLAQKGRAAGIHIVMATQRPSVDVISGVIKANFPTRIAFRTASVTDSLVIIDQPGAEKLLGKGDMLLLDPSKSGLERLQGYSS